MCVFCILTDVEGVTAEKLDWDTVCTRAEGTGWFPVIIPGCKQVLDEDGYGEYGT